MIRLRAAGVAYCNLVSVSSILPLNCKIIPKKRGEQLLNPGEITFCVMARSETNERNRLVSASIGLAIPTDRRTYGYLSEHHAHGETDEETGEYTEDLAAQMLASGALPEGETRLTLHQGVEMGRPSVIGMAAAVAGGRLAEVRIAGSAVPVSEGKIRVPDHTATAR